MAPYIAGLAGFKVRKHELENIQKSLRVKRSPAGTHVPSSVEKNGTFHRHQFRSQQNFLHTGIACGT